jgi:hypothetical protein
MNSIRTKILQLAVLTVLFSVGLANASVTLTIGTVGWGNSTTTGVNGMPWGILVNTSGAFDGNTVGTLQSALEGFSIPSTANPSTPVQIGSTGFYFAKGQDLTANGPPNTSFAPGFMNTAHFNLTGVSSGNPFGVLWFSDAATTAGSHFGFQIPTGTNTLPSDGATTTVGSINTTPGLGSYTIGAAPEPSRVILTALGLGLITLRRRRRR